MTQKFSGAEQLIKNWLQNKNTIDFLGVWEKINNPSFNSVEFHQIKEEAAMAWACKQKCFGIFTSRETVIESYAAHLRLLAKAASRKRKKS